jgi:hypothetical protein
MKLTSSAFFALPMLLLLGCESGPVSEKSQEERASLLVRALNEEGGNFTVTKAITQVGGFSVILDKGSIFQSDRHLAIDVSGYNYAFSYGYSYLDRMTREGNVYNNLTSLGNGNYKDSRSGLVFSKLTSESMVDAATSQAIESAEKALKLAAVLETNYGMSQEAAMRAGAILANISSDSSYAQVNEAAKLITGSSIEEMQSAVGKPEAEKALIAKFQKNGISVASLSSIMELMSQI